WPRASARARPTLRPAPVTRATLPRTFISPFRSGHSSRSARCDALVLIDKPFRRNAHHAELSSALDEPMPVGAATAHELQLADERIDADAVAGRMTGMQDLDAVESNRGHGGDAIASAELSRMREDSETA